MCEFGCSALLPFFPFVPHLLYLSFYNRVPDPDMSINKLGLPLHYQTQAMFTFRPVLIGWGGPSGPLGPSRTASLWAQVESRCATKHQHLLVGLTSA